MITNLVNRGFGGLETPLGLVEQVGLQNWPQTQAGSAS